MGRKFPCVAGEEGIATRLARRVILAPTFFLLVASGYGQDPPARPIPVYVSDFELSAAALRPPFPVQQTPRVSAVAQKSQQGSTGSSAPDGASPLVYKDADAPYVQARCLIDFLSKTLLETLQRNGYAADPQLDIRPSSGVLIRGIFAEYDDLNRVRRAILGSASTSPKFALYVGIFNLSRPDQPLYELATVQSPDNRYGPIITLNNYIPLAKYELDKNPTQEDVRRLCSRIVLDLTNLLDANPHVFARQKVRRQREAERGMQSSYVADRRGMTPLSPKEYIDCMGEPPWCL